jgi:hypothetical protein
MHNTIAPVIRLLQLAVVVSASQLTARAAEPPAQWEYQVLTKAQLFDLGNKDLATGLNKLGNEGWELAAIDSAYIFKRPKVQRRVEVMKLRLKLAESDVDHQKDRVQWAERMLKKGFLSGNQLKEEVRLLRELEIVLEEIEADMKSQQTEPKKATETEPKPKK